MYRVQGKTLSRFGYVNHEYQNENHAADVVRKLTITVVNSFRRPLCGGLILARRTANSPAQDK